MKSCISEIDFNRFIEGTLSDEELSDLNAHLKECDGCRNELEGWWVLKSTLLSAGEIEIPETLKSRVMNRISKVDILPAQSLWTNRAVAAAALILLMLVTLFQPQLKPVTDSMFKEGIAYLSELFYSVINFIGLDMKSVMSIFRFLISLFNKLFWMFSLSTLMMIGGFFLVILKGRRKLKSN